ncbi:MAG: hypothetical protein Q8Q58_10695, partial [Candidatus Rokubacteria bacterium]|nr:hypothetical protein [Candidatus Rokubacteria bacterium]
MFRLLLALLLLGVPLLASAQEASAPGPGPVGPAPDGPHPARIGEIVEPPPPRGYAEDIKVLK